MTDSQIQAQLDQLDRNRAALVKQLEARQQLTLDQRLADELHAVICPGVSGQPCRYHTESQRTIRPHTERGRYQEAASTMLQYGLGVPEAVTVSRIVLNLCGWYGQRQGESAAGQE